MSGSQQPHDVLIETEPLLGGGLSETAVQALPDAEVELAGIRALTPRLRNLVPRLQQILQHLLNGQYYFSQHLKSTLLM